MADVFLCKSGSLTAASRRELKRAGVVVVEVENPADCQFVRASEIVSGDDMLWAALDALRRDYGDYSSDKEAIRKARSRFTLNMFELVDAARTTDQPSAADGAPPPSA